jgi:phospholipase/carboxylesterase
MMQKSIESRKIGEWVIMQQIPSGVGPFPIMLLLHGWTGDESVMWIFTRRLSQRYMMISPRGIYPISTGGFGWQPQIRPEWPAVKDFKPSADRLIQLLSPVNFPDGDFSNFSAIGFSQGAALMFTLALLNPRLIKALAGLAGFLPKDATDFISGKPLTNQRIFMANGRLDDKVPVEKARNAVEILSLAGAQVNYCEEDVGHKLSSSCFRSMESFFNLIEDP